MHSYQSVSTIFSTSVEQGFKANQVIKSNVSLKNSCQPQGLSLLVSVQNLLNSAVRLCYIVLCSWQFEAFTYLGVRVFSC